MANRISQDKLEEPVMVGGILIRSADIPLSEKEERPEDFIVLTAVKSKDKKSSTIIKYCRKENLDSWYMVVFRMKDFLILEDETLTKAKRDTLAARYIAEHFTGIPDNFTPELVSFIGALINRNRGKSALPHVEDDVEYEVEGVEVSSLVVLELPDETRSIEVKELDTKEYIVFSAIDVNDAAQHLIRYCKVDDLIEWYRRNAYKEVFTKAEIKATDNWWDAYAYMCGFVCEVFTGEKDNWTLQLAEFFAELECDNYRGKAKKKEGLLMDGRNQIKDNSTKRSPMKPIGPKLKEYMSASQVIKEMEDSMKENKPSNSDVLIPKILFDKLKETGIIPNTGRLDLIRRLESNPRLIHPWNIFNDNKDLTYFECELISIMMLKKPGNRQEDLFRCKLLIEELIRQER